MIKKITQCHADRDLNPVVITYFTFNRQREPTASCLQARILYPKYFARAIFYLKNFK